MLLNTLFAPKVSLRQEKSALSNAYERSLSVAFLLHSGKVLLAG